MIKMCSVVFLVIVILLSLLIQFQVSLQEGQTIIEDSSGNKITVVDASGNKTTVIDASGNMVYGDAEGDKMWTTNSEGKIIKNASYDIDSAFPDYHDSASVLASKDAKIKGGMMTVKGPSGELIEVPWTGKQTDINYNEPGYFRYQPSSFIPNYEDSVYLSRLTGLSTTMKIEDSASKKGGFCEYNKDSTIKIEEECGKLDKNTCGSTSCCALLGGSRCVGGNANGPTMKANYGDITIQNRDHYFHQGKCYGNCPY